MAFFVYKVRDQNGKPLGGTIEADNPSQVANRLREAGYIVTSIQAKKRPREITISFGSGVKIKDIAILSRQLAIMSRSGIGLLRCLDILSAQLDNKTLKGILPQVKKSVEEGNSLSQTLSAYPRIFPQLFVNMLRAGETGGFLDEALERLAVHFDKEHELREKVKSATVYPVVITLFALGVINVLMLFVIPQFVQMFDSFGADLPVLTKLIITLSHFVRVNFPYLITAIFVAVYLFVRYRKTPQGTIKLDTLALKLPVFGTMNLKLSVARFTRTLGTLVHSGVPILLALEVTEKTAGNSLVAQGIAAARESIKDGESIAGPLAAAGVFPPMVTQMIAVGEESGALEIMLARIADFYDREVNVMVESLTSLIEPFLIIFLAVIVGGIVASVMLPMFDVFSQIK